MEFHVIFLCVTNVLWYCEILCYIFLSCVVILFYVCCLQEDRKPEKKWLLYFSVCGMRSGVLCYIFLRVEWDLLVFVIKHALVFELYFCMCGTSSGTFCFLSSCRTLSSILYFIFFVCGMHSGILCHIFLHVERSMEFCVIFFHVWNALSYYGIPCSIFLHVECALVFCFYIFSCFSIYFMLHYTYFDFL